MAGKARAKKGGAKTKAEHRTETYRHPEAEAALRPDVGVHDESVWDRLAGTMSAPFEAGEHGHVAVKVIDDRGNELMVVKSLKEAV